MKLRKGDKVKIISGKDKGKIGSVLRVFKEDGKVLVEGLNLVKRHVKPGAVSKDGGIISVEKPIDVSNVMYFNADTNEVMRLGVVVRDGKSFRVGKKAGKLVDIK